MDEFIGRASELELLASAHASKASAFVPIYGRRRVGKSELILRFLGGRTGVYFLGKQATAALQIREFLEEAAVVLNEPLLAAFPADNWGAALDVVVDRWSGKGKLILALDEFQWTAQASPELPSLLQERWDRRWKNTGKVMLILCGSYVGFMEREVLGKKSPLFGRRTAQIHLKPFGYQEAALFHPKSSIVDQAKIYMICGGIPLYLRQFLSEQSVEMNIKEALLNEFAPLHREPDFLLREELREIESYYGILLALASGAPNVREIAKRTALAERSLPYYLGQLQDLGYLRRRYPVTGGARVARNVRYEIDDPLLSFWFRFVYPNTSFIGQMGPERTISDRIRPALDAYFGRRFERLCQEALPVLYRQEGVSVGYEIGEYWDKTTQIDVVGFREDGWTDLAECKWGAISRKAVEAELEAKVTKYPNPRNATIGRRVFARLPPRTVGDRVRWFGLKDLYLAAQPKARTATKRRVPKQPAS